MDLIIKGHKSFVQGEISLPGDKSISHRALLIGALPKGKYKITNFPFSEDCISTLNAMKALGVKIYKNYENIELITPGYRGFNSYVDSIDCGNSGTTARLITGLLCGANVQTKLLGDASLSKRPMDRVIGPLKDMGGNIESIEGKLPLSINKSIHGTLKGIDYNMLVDSAQVKSSILIAGYMAEGITKVTERNYSRNHTELLFKFLGADLLVQDKAINIKNSEMYCKDLNIPGDISSAAFIIALTILTPKSSITINNLLLNKRRKRYIEILKLMGADIEYQINGEECGEAIGSLQVKSSELKPIIIEEEDIPNIIDEIPIFSILASFCSGVSIIKGVNELKYKESNRISCILNNLSTCDINCSYIDNNLYIEGKEDFINKDITIETLSDHRIAMAFAVLASRNKGATKILNWDCTKISFPDSEKYFRMFLNF